MKITPEKIEATFEELMEELISGKYGQCAVADKAKEYLTKYKDGSLKILKRRK